MVLDLPQDAGWIELLLVVPNDIAGGFLGLGLLGTVFTLSFAAGLQSGDVMKAYLGACFLSFGTAVFLMALGILSEVALIAVIIGYLLGLALIS